MTSWLRSRVRLGSVVLILVGVAACLTMGASPFPVPRLGGAAPVATALVAPALVAAGALGFLRPPTVPEQRSVRPVARLGALLLLGTTGLVAAVLLASGLSWHEPLYAAAVRNLAAYVGVGLCARPLYGAGASAAPVGYALLVAVLGSPTATLSFPLARPGDVSAAVLAAALLLGGSAAGLRRG